MNNHARSTDSAYRNSVFKYKRPIQFSQGEGCLGYTTTRRPGRRGLNKKIGLHLRACVCVASFFTG